MTVHDINERRNQLVEEAWQEFVVTARKAQQTLAIEDGLAAGRAWKAFLDLFLADETERPKVGATVIRPSFGSGNDASRPRR